jgi:hypothetical protein
MSAIVSSHFFNIPVSKAAGDFYSIIPKVSSHIFDSFSHHSSEWPPQGSKRWKDKTTISEDSSSASTKIFFISIWSWSHQNTVRNDCIAMLLLLLFRIGRNFEETSLKNSKQSVWFV